ncbi:MAG: hypothetical protein AB7I27_14280 [Bacteriovoracaceae bacterium]
MKIQKIIFLILLPLTSWSQVIPYNQNQCNPQVAQVYQVFTTGKLQMSDGYSVVTFDVDEGIKFVQEYLTEIESDFNRAGDITLLSRLDPLCVALYNDNKGANALAIGEDHVLFGLNLIHDLQAEWKIDGILGIKAILSHEYGHILQNRHHLNFNFPLQLYATKRKELQADCIAGVLLNYHIANYKVIVEADKLMQMIGDHHGLGDHGMYPERREALLNGMREAIKLMMKGKTRANLKSKDIIDACLAYYPTF